MERARWILAVILGVVFLFVPCGCGGLRNIQPPLPLTEKASPKTTLNSDRWKAEPDYMAAFQKQFEAEVANDVAESRVRVQQVELRMLRDGLLGLLPPWRAYYYIRCFLNTMEGKEGKK